MEKSRKEKDKRYEEKHVTKRKEWRRSEAGKACRLRYDRSDKRKVSSDGNRSHLNAREAVRRAVRKGVLVKPDMCSNCKRQDKLQAHHHNGYEKSCQLDVIWLCSSCHHQAEHN